MELPAIPNDENVDAAAKLLKRYYSRTLQEDGAAQPQAATLMNGPIVATTQM
ncbi:hypothetical protein [Pseudarthrobacter sp. H2]|uniref:hypothetical protein n=1 Tax=Pseudarthrobacter sp. H2 TaxID=3418415 RepID=UPI003CEBE727